MYLDVERLVLTSNNRSFRNLLRSLIYQRKKRRPSVYFTVITKNNAKGIGSFSDIANDNEPRCSHEMDPLLVYFLDTIIYEQDLAWSEKAYVYQG